MRRRNEANRRSPEHKELGTVCVFSWKSLTVTVGVGSGDITEFHGTHGAFLAVLAHFGQAFETVKKRNKK